MRVFMRIFFLGMTLAAMCAPLAAQSSQPMYLYVPNNSTGNPPVGIVSAFKVNPTTGALSVVPGSPFQAGTAASTVAVDPAGRFVYVSSAVGGPENNLWVFSVDQTSGLLTPLSGAPFSGGGSPIAIDPTGRFLYAQGQGGLCVYSIDPVSGVPTAISGSPFSVTTASPLAFDPSGNFVYFLNGDFWYTDAINFETGAPTPIDGIAVSVPGLDHLWDRHRSA